METQQLQSAKYWRLQLASELSLGLLHQINNQMTGILFNHEECQLLVGADHPAAASLARMKPSIEKVNKLVDRLREIHLSRFGNEESYYDLSELVEQQLDLLRIIVPKTAQIEFTRGLADSRVVKLCEADFRTVLLYLALWARPALTAQGAQLILGVQLLENLRTKDSSFSVDLPAESLLLILSVPKVPGFVREENPSWTHVDESVSDAALQAAQNLARDFRGQILIAEPLYHTELRAFLILPGIDLNA